MSKCAFPGCRREGALTYLGKDVCIICWETKVTKEILDPKRLCDHILKIRTQLGINLKKHPVNPEDYIGASDGKSEDTLQKSIPAKVLTKYVCPVCGKETAGKSKKQSGDIVMYPRKHSSKHGDPCIGCMVPANEIHYSEDGKVIPDETDPKI